MDKLVNHLGQIHRQQRAKVIGPNDQTLLGVQRLWEGIPWSIQGTTTDGGERGAGLYTLECQQAEALKPPPEPTESSCRTTCGQPVARVDVAFKG